jgi:hypothetical protein
LWIIYEIAALAQRAAPAASTAPHASPSQVDSPNSLHLAGYHDRATKRFTTGRNVREYERLTQNGFVKVVDFDSEDEARAWLRQKNGAPTALTPSSPNPRDELASDSSEGGISAQILDLTTLLHTLESKLDDLEKASTPTMGVSLDKFSFDTIDELVAPIRKENTPTTAFGVAVDPVSFFCHHKSGRVEDVKHSNEMKAMKLAGISNIIALRFVGSFRHMHPPYFLNACASPISHGQRFPILDGEAAWHGTGLSKGSCVELEKGNRRNH